MRVGEIRFSQAQVDSLWLKTVEKIMDGKLYWKRDLKSIKYIVIHNTAMRNDLNSDEVLLSMKRHWVENRWMKYIPAHYSIDKWWDFSKASDFDSKVGADIDRIIWATLNSEANLYWIHIEVSWEFEKYKPSDEQYEMINKLIGWIQEEVPSATIIKWHKDFQNKPCPWKYFDWSRIKWSKEYMKENEVVLDEWKINLNPKWYGKREYLGEGRITAYYTSLEPCKWDKKDNCQDRYYDGRSFEEERKINGDFVNAEWWDYKEEHKYTHWACDNKYFGKKIYVEWWGVVYCSDKWSGVNGNRIDIWYGIWQEALNRIDGKDDISKKKIHPRNAKVYLIND